MPEGISRTRLGELRVRDPAYMAALHAQKVQPLDLGTGSTDTTVDLHHSAAPVRHSKRRDFDSGVVPLRHEDHMNIEAGAIEEKAFGRVFAIWSAFRYFCWQHQLEGRPEDALEFNRWVLEKLEEENGT